MNKILLSQLLSKCERALAIICCILAVFMMVIMTADIIMRYAGKPITGVYELVPLLLVCISFLGLAYTESEGAHLRIAIITDKLPDKKKNIFSLINLFLSACVMVFMTWGAILAARYSIITGEVPTMGSTIPIAPTRVAIAIGCLAFLIRLVFSLTQKKERHES